MDNLRNLMLGALLHDIGKVVQRAASNPTSATHSKFGSEFVQKLQIIDECVLRCIQFHHRAEIADAKVANFAEDDIAFIVYEADNIAAGTDRRENEAGQEDERQFNQYGYLETVFNLLPAKQNVQAEEKIKKSYSCDALSTDEEIRYPERRHKEERLNNAQYGKILNAFKEDISKSRGMLTPNFLLRLQEKYFSFIPSDTSSKNVCDISLFDHQKITAAVASCMYQYFAEKGLKNYKKACYNKTQAGINDDTELFLLVSGDISGVQDFIYNIASKGALKSLRARSFYLEILLEHFVDEVLEQLSLSRANLLYNGGGHFYMLLPNTKECRTILTTAEKNINRWFYNQYGTSLYLAMDSAECTPSHLKSKNGKNITVIYRALSQKISTKKLRRYSEDTELFRRVLSQEELLYGERECSVCGTSQQRLSGHKFSDDDSSEICSFCKTFVEMGKHLLQKDEYILIKENLSEKEAAACFILPDVFAVQNIESAKSRHDDQGNKYLYACDANSGTHKKILRCYSKNSFTVRAENEYAIVNILMGDYNFPGSKGNGELIEFEELASRKDKGGIKRLAVLRADVDNLGQIFMAGIPLTERTFSRTTVLSKSLNMFFKFYINRVAQDKKMVIVYAGGDDLFVVGAWDEVLEFAIQLRKAFVDYTCDTLSFSAGIAFFSDSFPIYSMAEFTGDLEQRAKEYQNAGYEKNAVALFGVDKTVDQRGRKAEHRHTYFWDEFDNEVRAEKLQFLKSSFYFGKEGRKVDKNQLIGSTSLLYRIKTLLQRTFTDQKNGENGRIDLARLAYTLARLEPANGTQEAKERYESIKKRIYHWVADRNTKHQKQLLTAIDLLIYEQRKGDK